MLQKQWRFFWQIMVTMVVSMGLLSPVVAKSLPTLADFQTADIVTTTLVDTQHIKSMRHGGHLIKDMCETFAQNAIDAPMCHGESDHTASQLRQVCESNCTMNACTVAAPSADVNTSMDWPKRDRDTLPNAPKAADFSSAIVATQTPPPRTFC